MNSSRADEILVALRRIMRATDLHSRRLLREFGITGPQLFALRAVGLRGEMSGSTLARAISVSLPTATDIVRRLEARRLFRRRRDEDDRRQVLISITSAGRRILKAAPPPLQASFTTQLDALPEWEQTQMLSTLQRLVSMMEAGDLDVSPGLPVGERPEPTGDANDGQAADSHG